LEPSGNAQIANTNAKLDNMNHKPKNINVQPVDMNAQIDNPNGQVQNNNINNPELNLAIIFKSMAQAMHRYSEEKSLQKFENEKQISQQINNLQMNQIRYLINNNQINNEPLQWLKNILMSQLFKLYSSPNQNRPAKNPPKVQGSRLFNNLKKAKNEINMNLKELINIIKLMNLIMLISNEDQKEKMSKQDRMLNELIESNKEQKAMLSELIKSNEAQKEFNKKVFDSIENMLALINDNKKSNTNNNQ